MFRECLELAAGDHCCVEPYVTCGHCIACRRGKTNCCTSMQVLGVQTDGGMRETLTVPVEMLHKSETASLDDLALVEMLSVGAHAVRRAQLGPEENVLVIGAGPIGLSVIQFAQLTGANVIVMEISEQRLEFARQQMGVEWWIDGQRDPMSGLQAILCDDLPTAVFDATGSARSMLRAFDYVAHGGRLIFVGLFQGDVTFHDPDFHRHEMTLLSSRNATAEDFVWAVEALEAGKINLKPWITHRASPEELATELPHWLEPESGMIKAMLEL